MKRGYHFKKLLFLGILGILVLCLVLSNFPSMVFSSYSSKKPGVIKYLQAIENTTFTENYIDRSEAKRLYEKVRILCLILTVDANFETKVRAVEGTWAKRCNRYYFIANTRRTGPHIINIHLDESRNNLMKKVKSAYKYVYDNFIDDFDWMFKADDDTYAILENMRFLLSNYNSSDKGYLGYHFNRYVYNGYMSGGAGYVLSNGALRSLVEEGIDKDTCNPAPTKVDPEVSEDVNIGKCLNKTGVTVLSSLDVHGRETFHPYPVHQNLLGELPSYMYSWSMNTQKTGPDCCSRFAISFHYMSEEAMILVDHLLYRTSVYGQTVKQESKGVFQIQRIKHKPHDP